MQNVQRDAATSGIPERLMGHGQLDALDELMPAVYEELKRMAHRHLRGDGVAATLSTTELVHEAYLKLAQGSPSDWENRAHFFGAASRAMRQVLVDFARRRNAARRGAGTELVSLGSHDAIIEVELDEILTVDAALEQLERVDPRLRSVVELRFFGGLAPDEIARLLGLSTRTVERDWLKARLIILETLGRAP
jgi:RNA polymerase sigma factor (TIGR02999 family)